MKIFVLAALAFLPLTANAGILFDNGIYNFLGGNEMGDALMAEDFNLGVTSDLTAIRYWTLEAPGAYLGSITWGIYADGGGQPGSFLAGGNTAVTVTPTPDSAFGLNFFQNDFNINVANLLA